VVIQVDPFPQTGNTLKFSLLTAESYSPSLAHHPLSSSPPTKEVALW
jgi:hypothetical protein